MITEQELIEKELAGLLPTVMATEEQFTRCNHCAYVFQTHLGEVDLHDVRRHKKTCRPRWDELFPEPPEHILRRFPHLIANRVMRVPVEAIDRPDDPFERRLNIDTADVFTELRRNWRLRKSENDY